MLRKLDPAIIVNNRLSKGRSSGFPKYGMAPPETTVGDFGTPEAGRSAASRATATPIGKAA